MGDITRQTMIFFLPLSLEAITGGVNPYSATGSDKTGTVYNDDGDPLWARRQLYINPQSLSFRESKMIKSDLTKGGFVTQYWGEALTKIEVGGTTGSSGIEGINVLRDIYRHEQIQYRDVLRKRQEKLAYEAQIAAQEAAALLAESSSGGITLTNVADVLTGGAFSDTVSGVSNAIDIISAPFTGSGTAASYEQFTSVPSLAAFATNVDMYYHGEFYRGYFENFSVTESAQEPGHFTYQFSFTVLRRTGRRENFMPWHREPLSYDGETMMSQSTTVDKGHIPGSDNLSFASSSTTVPTTPELYDNYSLNNNPTKSTFKDDDNKQVEPNSVNPNRKSSIKSGS